MNFSECPSMDNTQQSQLRIFSIGIVANNKPLSTDIIQATPIESLTMLDGDIISNPLDAETTGTDASGTSYSTKVKTDNAVDAKWLPMGSNRRTAPDVRRGERVLLWQYGDTDQYYWTDMGWDAHLRKLETVSMSFSATMDEEADSLDPNNCYSLEVSTHTGQITLRTSKANGEFCVYALQINTKEGRVLLTDELGNEFELDSKNTNIQLLNADKTIVQLTKRKIYMYAGDSIHAKAENSMLFQTNSYKIECQTYRLECNTGSVKGVMTFEDPVTFNQTVQVDGASTFNAPMTAKGITSSSPIVGPSDTI
jgi:hypothetical protein